MQPRKSIKWIYLVVLSLIWGSSFILMKRGLLSFRPDQLASIRMMVACFATFPLIARKLKEIPSDKWKYLLIVGVFGSGIPALLFATAQTHVSSSLAGMLNGLTPVFTMLIGAAIFKVRFNIYQKLGVFVGFLGAAGLVFIRADGSIEFNFLYAGLIVLATMFYGLSVNTIKGRLTNINSLVISGAGLLFVGIPYTIYLFSTDFLNRFNTMPEANFSFACICTLALFGTAVSNYIYFQLVKIAGPLFASIVTYLIPIVAMCWGFADGEKLSGIQVLAMIAILLGVALIAIKPKQASE
ncbi:MAG: DMT family transporter [Bacteroidota bacterium]